MDWNFRRSSQQSAVSFQLKTNQLRAALKPSAEKEQHGARHKDFKADS
jgi:hypothetical protein